MRFVNLALTVLALGILGQGSLLSAAAPLLDSLEPRGGQVGNRGEAHLDWRGSRQRSPTGLGNPGRAHCSGAAEEGGSRRQGTLVPARNQPRRVSRPLHFAGAVARRNVEHSAVHRRRVPGNRRSRNQRPRQIGRRTLERLAEHGAGRRNPGHSEWNTDCGRPRLLPFSLPRAGNSSSSRRKPAGSAPRSTLPSNSSTQAANGSAGIKMLPESASIPVCSSPRRPPVTTSSPSATRNSANNGKITIA